MNELMTPNAMTGPGKKLKALLDSATSQENILISPMPDRTLVVACGLDMDDGVVIDRGLNTPHTGGGYYLIQCGELEQIRCLAALPNNAYSIANDHASDIVSRDSIQVIGKVIGWVSLKTIQ